jgi:hypothetical protein
MQDTTQLQKNILAYTDDEFLKYINEYALSITDEAFVVVKQEMENRPHLISANNIESIQKNRYEKFIDELPKFIKANIKLLKTVEDFASEIVKQGYTETKDIMLKSVDVLKHMETADKRRVNIGLIALLVGILFTFLSFNNPSGSSSYIFYGAIFYGAYSVFGTNNTGKYHYLRNSIRSHFDAKNEIENQQLENDTSEISVDDSKSEVRFEHYSLDTAPESKISVGKNTFLYPEDGLGKMESGTVDSAGKLKQIHEK